MVGRVERCRKMVEICRERMERGRAVVERVERCRETQTQTIVYSTLKLQ